MQRQVTKDEWERLIKDIQTTNSIFINLQEGNHEDTSDEFREANRLQEEHYDHELDQHYTGEL